MFFKCHFQYIQALFANFSPNLSKNRGNKHNIKHHKIVTIVASPLGFYKKRGNIPLGFYRKITFIPLGFYKKVVTLQRNSLIYTQLYVFQTEY